MDEPVLELCNLWVDFDTKTGRKNAVSGVSLQLPHNRTLGVVGESGCGKSVTMLSVMKLLPNRTAHIREESSVKLNGKEISRLNNRAMCKIRGKNISMIFQDSGAMMNPVQTIGHQYIEYIRTHSDMSKEEAKQRAIDMLARMNLPNPENILNSYAFELSGGMRQRVGIAMAITFHPKLLLADEPTSALDVTTQAQIVKELMNIIKKGGASMIVVTHNIGVAAYMSDKIMVMAGGRVVEYGNTEDVIKNPKEAYTKKLLGSVPEIGGRRYA